MACQDNHKIGDRISAGRYVTEREVAANADRPLKFWRSLRMTLRYAIEDKAGECGCVAGKFRYRFFRHADELGVNAVAEVVNIEAGYERARGNG